MFFRHHPTNILLSQLDRYRRPSRSKSTDPNLHSETNPTSTHISIDVRPSSTSQVPDRPKAKLKSKTLDGSPDNDSRDERGTDGLTLGKTGEDQRNGDVPSWVKGEFLTFDKVILFIIISAHSPFVGAAPRPPEGLASSPSEERRVVSRSRWQAVLLEAGGLSAALSEESMRRLQYCLHWLQVIFPFDDFGEYILIIFHSMRQHTSTPKSSSFAILPPASRLGRHMVGLRLSRRHVSGRSLLCGAISCRRSGRWWVW